MKITSTILLILTLALNPLFAKEQLPPDEVVKNLMQRVMSSLKNKQDYYRKNPKQLDEYAESILKNVKPSLDMARMSWSIVGREWRRATIEDKKSFIVEFNALLIKTYVKSLLDLADKKVSYLPYRNIPGKRTTIVRGFTVDGNGKKSPINYRLYRSKKYGWRIYDVNVIGVSLIRSYKSSFKSTMKASGLSGLTKKLKQKNGK